VGDDNGSSAGVGDGSSTGVGDDNGSSTGVGRSSTGVGDNNGLSTGVDDNDVSSTGVGGNEEDASNGINGSSAGVGDDNGSSAGVGDGSSTGVGDDNGSSTGVGRSDGSSTGVGDSIGLSTGMDDNNSPSTGVGDKHGSSAGVGDADGTPTGSGAMMTTAGLGLANIKHTDMAATGVGASRIGSEIGSSARVGGANNYNSTVGVNTSNKSTATAITGSDATKFTAMAITESSEAVADRDAAVELTESTLADTDLGATKCTTAVVVTGSGATRFAAGGDGSTGNPDTDTAKDVTETWSAATVGDPGLMGKPTLGTLLVAADLDRFFGNDAACDGGTGLAGAGSGTTSPIGEAKPAAGSFGFRDDTADMMSLDQGIPVEAIVGLTAAVSRGAGLPVGGHDAARRLQGIMGYPSAQLFMRVVKGGMLGRWQCGLGSHAFTGAGDIGAGAVGVSSVVIPTPDGFQPGTVDTFAHELDLGPVLRAASRDPGESSCRAGGIVPSPPMDLFVTDSRAERLDSEAVQKYRRGVCALEFLCERGRPDVRCAVGFLWCTRGSQPDADDWVKLQRTFQYLYNTSCESSRVREGAGRTGSSGLDVHVSERAWLAAFFKLILNLSD